MVIVQELRQLLAETFIPFRLMARQNGTLE
jgi:hypothetical protein